MEWNRLQQGNYLKILQDDGVIRRSARGVEQNNFGTLAKRRNAEEEQEQDSHHMRLSHPR